MQVDNPTSLPVSGLQRQRIDQEQQQGAKVSDAAVDAAARQADAASVDTASQTIAAAIRAAHGEFGSSLDMGSAGQLAQVIAANAQAAMSSHTPDGDRVLSLIAGDR